MLSVLTFRTPAEAVEKANNTPYGLSAGVWTDKGSRILWMANQLRAGVVWANTFNKFDPTSPFGGYKESGYGREGGRHGLEAYLKGADALMASHRRAARPTSSTSAAQFPRSESGRTYVVTDAKGTLLANAAQASRKDARDAVVAARKAFGGWSGATAYNRGQVVYRIAEVLEGRRDQFVAEVRATEGVTAARPTPPSTPRSTGWSGTPAGPTRSPRWSAAPTRSPGPTSTSRSPEPTGVVAVVAPQESSLLGLVSVVAPVIVTGNTCVVIASEPHPLPAITLGEVLATSDLPGGVVNVLTGSAAEIAPWLASHMDVNAHRPDRRRATPSSRRRWRWPRPTTSSASSRAAAPRSTGWPTPGIDRMTDLLETKTVWHPIGI